MVLAQNGRLYIYPLFNSSDCHWMALILVAVCVLLFDNNTVRF